MKKLSLLCFLFFSVLLNAQPDFFKNLKEVLPKLSETEKIDTIVAIPFEIMNSQSQNTVEQYKYALEIAISIGDDNRKGEIYEKMGLAYYYIGDYETSVESMNKAIEFFEKVTNKVRMGSTYASMGYQMKRRNLLKAFEYMHKGIHILRNTDDEIALSATYNNIGVLHQMKDDLDSALYYFYLGYDIVKEENDSLAIPYSLNNIGQALVFQNKYKKALSHYEEAFEIRKIRNDKNGLAENYNYFGELYLATGQIDKAIENYLLSLKLSEKIKYTYLCQVNSNQLSNAYEKKGDFEQALFYSKQNQIYKDQILNEANNKTIAQLEVQFDTERKEKELAIKSSSVIKEKSIVRQRTSMLVAVSSTLIFILLIAALVYRQLKLKQKHLEKESALKDIIAEEETINKVYKERMRISRDLHDNIGSQLTFLISSMDNMQYISNKDKLKIKLHNLTSYTRETIDQLRDTIWAMNKNALSIEDLQIRIGIFIGKAKDSTEGVEFILDFDVKTFDYEITPAQGINLFRIIQEALNNAIKYACATNIIVKIHECKNEIIFSVNDNGKGFDGAVKNKGFGMCNMKARADEINAIYELTTDLNKGTLVTVVLLKNT